MTLGLTLPTPGNISTYLLSHFPRTSGAKLSTNIPRSRYLKGERANSSFFLGVGLRKPHLDWRVPQSYLDKYPSAPVAVAAHPVAYVHTQSTVAMLVIYGSILRQGPEIIHEHLFWQAIFRCL